MMEANSNVNKPHPLLQKPLYIYSLPKDLLEAIVLKEDALPSVEDQQGAESKPDPQTRINASQGAGCLTCNIGGFNNVSEQREHVRSDLHKFNLKRKLRKMTAVTADEFDQMLDGLLYLTFHSC
jgi:hypothetical protein